MGINVTCVSRRLARITGSFLCAADSTLHEVAADRALAGFWALKEAASKALGLGIGLGLTAVTCKEIAPRRYRLLVCDGPELRAAPVLPRLRDRRVRP